MNTRHITISDCSLRDGNHALKHQLTKEQISEYCEKADHAGIDIIEVGHGYGLGASSTAFGLAKVDDETMLSIAREKCVNSKLGIHFVPGVGKHSELEMAMEIGVDIFRIASHCTEGNITHRSIEHIKKSGKKVFGVLIMSHMADAKRLLKEATGMKSAGADGIVLMDSAGYSTPDLVREKISTLVDNLGITIGYHAHNNLGLAVANSIEAVESGASMIDATIKGFGAGSGNTQLEAIVAVLERYGFLMNTKFKNLIDLSIYAEQNIISRVPDIKAINIMTGMHGLFTGYGTYIQKISSDFNVDIFELCERLASRKLVASQEDIILEEANKLAKKII
ncbi:4-hydroxy-2-oxovalerate aldolase [Marinomonas posidonica]|uniref:4-hydroxy-2-oxovalerate aldolase n=1 Tax=Marinomonas posidonica (strain CECT 7376 / NCIMB 14433 / IVIA-Po-181) TaxID=491952 RepID=F6CSV2_MARPP|nr:4-hydroxy-2-oxovalerate aldolase [Marinomonas posidonica]AEF53942.1 4-hydroxy-2-oxovalerate aldolase [Marinomonas posidonica IVIA-Po-181]